MPRVDLTGKPIAITGASSGIGAATAIACAAAGMPVALGARRADRLEAVAAEIRSTGGKAIVVETDVTNPEDCRHFVSETIRAFGSIYSIYANAGYGMEAAVHEMTDRQMRDIFEVNFFGTLNTIRPAIPHMIEARSGHVLICSSCVARLSLPYYAAYSATKSAQAHLGRAMNLELRPHNLHVSTVFPVSTATEFFDNVKTESGQSRYITHTPSMFVQTPQRVARATVACLRRPRAEVWTSLATRLGMAVCNAFPGIEHMFLSPMVNQRLRDAVVNAPAPTVEPLASPARNGLKPVTTAPAARQHVQSS